MLQIKHLIAGDTPLVFAASQGHVDCVKVLIAAGADMKKGTELPLIKSIKSRSVESVKELLNAGADVNSEDDQGNTSLMIAIDVGNVTLAQLLVDKGADVNSKNIDGKTASGCKSRSFGIPEI